MVNQDRRNDIGVKLFIGIITGVVLLLLTLFINAAWETANEGSRKANDALNRVTILEQQYNYIKDDLGEIKSILRRTIPVTAVIPTRNSQGGS